MPVFQGEGHVGVAVEGRGMPLHRRALRPPPVLGQSSCRKNRIMAFEASGPCGSV
jgi:hypothetical protein